MIIDKDRSVRLFLESLLAKFDIARKDVRIKTYIKVEGAVLLVSGAVDEETAQLVRNAQKFLRRRFR